MLKIMSETYTNLREIQTRTPNQRMREDFLEEATSSLNLTRE